MPPWIRVLGAALIALAAAPTLLVVGEALALGSGASVVPWIEGAFGAICHHLPERTFPGMSVCARCTGLYVGAGLGVLGALVPPERRILRAALLLLGASGSIGLGAALAEAIGLLDTSNVARVGLGALLGLPAPLVAALGGRVLLSVPDGPR